MKKPHKNISQIIERLPLHRQLNESQAMLLKITPIWLHWSATHLSNNHSSETNSHSSETNSHSSETNNHSPEANSPAKQIETTFENTVQCSCTLADISNGTLQINCASSVEASQIKHQQTSLVSLLNAADISEITHIKVCVSPQLHTNLQAKQTTLSAKQHSEQPIEQQHWHIKPSTTSIQSIEQCGQEISNTQLSESLRRLAETLNKTL